MEAPIINWVRVDYEVVDPYVGVNTIKSTLLSKGALVVVNHEDGAFVGVLTPKDLLSHHYNLVIDCLRHKVRISEDSNWTMIIDEMLKNNELVLPYFDTQGFKGLLFLEDIFQYIYTKSIKQVKKLLRSKLKIKNSDKVLNALYENTHSVRFLVDQNYKILFFNKKAAEIGVAFYGREIKIGDSLIEFAQHKQNNIEITFQSDFERALKGEVVDAEKEIEHELKKFWFRVEYHPIYIKESELVGVSINIVDITHEKERASCLEMQNKALKEIMAFQSHQVRRPVANILGLVQIIDKNELSQHNSLMVAKLEEAAKELDGIIRHVVDKASYWAQKGEFPY